MLCAMRASKGRSIFLVLFAPILLLLLLLFLLLLKRALRRPSCCAKRPLKAERLDLISLYVFSHCTFFRTTFIRLLWGIAVLETSASINQTTPLKAFSIY